MPTVPDPAAAAMPVTAGSERGDICQVGAHPGYQDGDCPGRFDVTVGDHRKSVTRGLKDQQLASRSVQYVGKVLQCQQPGESLWRVRRQVSSTRERPRKGGRKTLDQPHETRTAGREHAWRPPRQRQAAAGLPRRELAPAPRPPHRPAAAMRWPAAPGRPAAGPPTRAKPLPGSVASARRRPGRLGRSCRAENVLAAGIEAR